MQDAGRKSESRSTPQYTARSATRHRSNSSIRRLVFFTLASVWGFIAGVTGVLIALAAAGEAVEARPAIIAGLVPALLLAMAGGLIVAAAYRESKTRSR
jgi:ATP/ADP translocase